MIGNVLSIFRAQNSRVPPQDPIPVPLDHESNQVVAHFFSEFGFSPVPKPIEISAAFRPLYRLLIGDIATMNSKPMQLKIWCHISDALSEAAQAEVAYKTAGSAETLSAYKDATEGVLRKVKLATQIFPEFMVEQHLGNVEQSCRGILESIASNGLASSSNVTKDTVVVGS